MNENQINKNQINNLLWDAKKKEELNRILNEFQIIPYLFSFRNTIKI